MGGSSAWIAGSYQSDFARNYAREGLEISDMVAEAVEGTLHSAGLEPEDVESIHVGNAFGQVDNAKTFATLNIGGSLTTTVSFVVTGQA